MRWFVFVILLAFPAMAQQTPDPEAIKRADAGWVEFVKKHTGAPPVKTPLPELKQGTTHMPKLKPRDNKQ